MARIDDAAVVADHVALVRVAARLNQLVVVDAEQRPLINHLGAEQLRPFGHDDGLEALRALLCLFGLLRLQSLGRLWLRTFLAFLGFETLAVPGFCAFVPAAFTLSFLGISTSSQDAILSVRNRPTDSSRVYALRRRCVMLQDRTSASIAPGVASLTEPNFPSPLTLQHQFPAIRPEASGWTKITRNPIHRK